MSQSIKVAPILILSALAVSAFLAVSQTSIRATLSTQKQDLVETEKSHQDGEYTTFYEREKCISEYTLKQCTQVPVDTDCNLAAISVAGLEYSLKACQEFSKYAQYHQGIDDINYDNFYSDCYTNTDMLNNARKSNFYFYNNYQIKYLICGGLPFNEDEE